MQAWNALKEKTGLSLDSFYEKLNKEKTDKQNKNTPAEKIASVHIDFNKDNFIGKEFQGIKGKDAIEKLLQEKHGYVKNAFERNEIGDIALVWGNKNVGLLHALLKRGRLKEEKGHISGIEMVKNTGNYPKRNF